VVLIFLFSSAGLLKLGAKSALLRRNHCLQ